MTPKMISFLSNLGLNNIERFDLEFIKAARRNDKPDEIDLIILKKTLWQIDLLQEFLAAIGKITYKANFQFRYEEAITPLYIYELFDSWYFMYYREYHRLEYEVGDNLTFYYEDQATLTKYQEVFQEFQQLLAFIGYQINLQHLLRIPLFEVKKTEEEIEDFPEEDDGSSNSVDEETEMNMLEEIEAMHIQKKTEVKKRSSFSKGNYVKVSIKEISRSYKNVEFSGQVFSFEKRSTRRGLIYILGLVENDEAVYVRIYGNATNFAPKNIDYEIKDNLKIKGSVQIDFNSEEMSVLAHFIEKLPLDPPSEDKSPEKRVELHLHTKMSYMDGVSSIEDYCQVAKEMGHTALAITDHGVVQSFPQAMKAGKNAGLKIIYGSELYIIDQKVNYIYNPTSKNLADLSYVSFDLETTGLSIEDNKIIEFGAVKVNRGMVVATLDLLINPGSGVVLSPKVQEITNITPAMLKKEPSLKEVMPKIIEFIGNDILLSHNAKFDIGFLEKAMLDLGYGPLNNPVIDTLPISRTVFYESSAHNLGALARKMEVSYEESKAHRADYDAKVLSDIWHSLSHILTDKYGVKTHEDIASLNKLKESLVHIYPDHVTVLAKNQTGIKDLYHLTSLAHTKFWMNVPRVPKDELAKLRSNLLIGSSCFNGELFELARHGNLSHLKEAMKFYDYVEIQPLENYRYLIAMNEVEDDFQLRKIIARLISVADELGKLIVATGDVHYAKPSDKKYRDVYIAAKGLKGINHPLNPYARRRVPIFENPDQHYRSTDEMLEAFKWIGEEKAYEYVVKNTQVINQSIEEGITPLKEKLYTPEIENVDKFLTDLVYSNAQAQYGKPLPLIIKNRLEVELKGIISNGYAVIYYLAHKITKKVLDNGYLVGSRGSVGSSLVATMAKITEVNPLKPHYYCPKCHYSDFNIDDKKVRSGFDLPPKKCPNCQADLIGEGQNIPFATFLGFEAEKVPDIDLNFPPDYQNQAHEYTKELLGEKNVYRAGTIETVANRTAIGYVRGYYESLGYDLSQIKWANIAYLASGCEGVKRTTGQHPGGLVVIPSSYEVEDFTPIQFPADNQEEGNMTTHFDFKAIHDNVLKLDLLGHVDPQAIRMMCQLTNVAIHDIPFNDPEALSLYTSSKALKFIDNTFEFDNGAQGLPEFGTNFVGGILSKTQPKTFGELVIVSGLSHGTGVWQNNIENLFTRKDQGFEDIIGCRDDIMIYLINKGIKDKAAFAISEDVRKGKVLKEESIILMKKHEISDTFIDVCNKIAYLFPKAHAVAYVMMAMRVAWFKVHHPLAYYATYFTLRADQFDLENMLKSPREILQAISRYKEGQKISTKHEQIAATLMIVLEMAQRGYQILNIDLEKSLAKQFVIDEERKGIIAPFIVLDGVGENAANSIVEAREERMFVSQKDLQERTKITGTNLNDLRRLNVLKGIPETDQLSLFDF